jgi:hypothetical protein
VSKIDQVEEGRSEMISLLQEGYWYQYTLQQTMDKAVPKPSPVRHFTADQSRLYQPLPAIARGFPI